MFAQYYNRAAKNLLPPLALIVACSQSIPDVVKGIRTMHPAGCMIVFLIAYLAGLSGSVAVLAIACAFLAGLYMVQLSVKPRILKAELITEPQAQNVPTYHSDPFAGLQAAGLEVREIKIGRPTGKPRTVKTV